MIEINDLTKRYGEQLLFEKASFSVFSRERIGLVGRNGHGKSTLLKIITGVERADEGRVAIPKNYRIGYLHQLINFASGTVLAEVAKGLPEGSKDDLWRVKKILTGLGFQDEDLEKYPSIFSGGYQMRMELAKVLVSEPDMLLLDEPTNFLDIISIRWLEKFLKSWRGELVIISHDRSFMDSVITHVVGIHRARVRKSKGTTSRYYAQVEKDEEVYEKRRVNEEKKRKQIETYISTFRAKARRAKSVQSSVKRLDRMETIEKLGNIRTLSFTFRQAPFRPPVVMDAKGICFSYTEEAPYLINDLSLTVQRGDKICIAGANGKGKTTLAKVLGGVLAPAKGEIKRNPQVVMAYYEQGNTAKLNDTSTVEEEIASAYVGRNKTEVSSICGAMMFSGDNMLKKISVLSGGERSRVLLAKTLLSESNLLILDEPTHHLDMESCSGLFEAVQEYAGAAIVVTHDEYFLHKVATKLIMFTGGRIIVFPGNYSEFLDSVGWAESDPVSEINGSDKKGRQEVEASKGVNKKELRRLRAQKMAYRREKLGPIEAAIDNIEKDIARRDEEYSNLTEELIRLSEENTSPAAIAEASKRLNTLKSETERLYEALESKIKQFEQVREQLGENLD